VLIQSDFDIFGGTMGAVAGEKIVRSFIAATAAEPAIRH
jgi:acetyl-CoA carboxylase beta subunit